ncbi:MAG: dihydrofolate reductase family protein [Actinobacteria bacterium]|jgi:5-amino-6-(5-phosphoribosylamino)uracil reductase|nr:dihydrofolate reductase family protein [Actinomycetota bacterium]
MSDGVAEGDSLGDNARDGRPYTVLSCCMSLDGYISSASGGRLTLSNTADLDRVDAVRARCDAILVGAGTIRADNPRLLVRDTGRVARRTAGGAAATPVKVTVTAAARLTADADFFRTGLDKLVYCRSTAVHRARRLLGERASVVDAGDPVRMGWVSRDLLRRGIRRLMVEGGGRIHTQFLTDNLVDEMHLVIAPVFVGDARARRFVDDGRFPYRSPRRARLVESRAIGDVVLMRYALSDRFDPDVFDPALAELAGVDTAGIDIGGSDTVSLRAACAKTALIDGVTGP